MHSLTHSLTIAVAKETEHWNMKEKKKKKKKEAKKRGRWDGGRKGTTDFQSES